MVEKWRPTIAIDTYRQQLPYYFTYKQKSDIAYSMQYLEYLSRQLNASNSSVISKMIIKSYVITAVSIIETILLQELRHHNLQPRKMYAQENIIKSEHKIENGFKYLYKTIKLKVTNQKIIRPPLDKIIKASVNHKLLGLEQIDRDSLDKLRHLRNKIHLNTDEAIIKHDYNSFNFDTYHLSIFYIYKLLKNYYNEELLNYFIDYQ